MCCTKLSCLLLVGDEVLPLDLPVPAHFTTVGPTIVSDDFLPNGGLRATDQRLPRSAMSESRPDERVTVSRADAVQQQVHGRQPSGAVNELVAADQTLLQLGSLSRRHRFCALLGMGHWPPGGSRRSRRLVDDCVVDCRLDDVDDRLDEARGVKYWPAPDPLSEAPFAEQFLVGIALDVGPDCDQFSFVDEVDDEPLELGRVLNAVLVPCGKSCRSPGWRASPLRIRVLIQPSWSPWASEQLRQEYSSGTICCGFSFRVARSCAILRNNR